MNEKEFLKEFREKISNPKERSHSFWLVKEAIKKTLYELLESNNYDFKTMGQTLLE